jgi:hypothetical protein
MLHLVPLLEFNPLGASNRISSLLSQQGDVASILLGVIREAVSVCKLKIQIAGGGPSQSLIVTSSSISAWIRMRRPSGDKLICELLLMLA